MEKVKIGVIGIGMIGELHARIFRESAYAELVGICDINEEKGKKLAKELQTEFRKDFKSFFQLPVDAVSICLPEHLHFEPTLKAISFRKHVLIEKPITSKIDEGERILKEAERNPKLKIMVAHILRFDPRYAGIKDVIEEGKLGNISHIYARRNNRLTDAKRIASRVSQLLYLGVHDIDLMLWYVKDQVEKVFAVSHTEIMKEYRVPDVILGVLKFKNGVVASLELSWILPEQYPAAIDSIMEVVGTKGIAEVNVRKQGLMVMESQGRLVYPDTLHWTSSGGRIIGDLREELEAFARCIVEDKEVPVTVKEGLEALKVALSLEESYKKGTPITLV